MSSSLWTGWPIGLGLVGLAVYLAYKRMQLTRAYRRVRELEGELRHAQAVADLGRFAGSVVHDLNNVLTTITGHVSLAVSTLPAGSAAQQDLAEIDRAVDRALATINELLAFIRKEAPAPVVCDLNQILIESGKLLYHVHGKAVRIETALDPQLHGVRANPIDLQRVIINLVTNARDAMPAGGIIRIKTENVMVDGFRAPARLKLPPGEYAVLSVADTGTGMPPEMLHRIFEPFYTTKRLGEGTGLGLSTVRRIVEQARGGIFVESTFGHGSRFYVYLPAV